MTTLTKIKIFNSESKSEVEEEFEQFFKNKKRKLIDFKYSSTGTGGLNRDCVCILYEEKMRGKEE